MNLTKKISNMGFRKTQFHKSEYDYDIHRHIMVPDIYHIDRKWDKNEKKMDM